MKQMGPPALIDLKHQTQQLMAQQDDHTVKPPASSALHALLQPATYQPSGTLLQTTKPSMSSMEGFLQSVPPDVEQHRVMMTSSMTSLHTAMTSHSDVMPMNMPSVVYANEGLGIQDNASAAATMLASSPYAVIPSPPKAIPVMVEQASVSVENSVAFRSTSTTIKTDIAALTTVSRSSC